MARNDTKKTAPSRRRGAAPKPDVVEAVERASGGIDVEHVTKRFGDFVALDDVSLTVPSGGLTALLGPSGSGKSTLLRVIAGLEQPDAGSVVIAGQDSTTVRVQDRNVGFVFQHYAAFKHMTVFDNIAFGLRIRGEGNGKIRERVRQLIELVHLRGFERRFPNQLSGGQRQRMALARALAVEPSVLLLDEPFGALDAKVREELRTWLRRLHDDVHVTTIFVTHDQEEAMDVAEQIVVMSDGKIEQSGAPRDLYEDPASEFVMSFIGTAHRLGESWVRPHDVEIRHEPNGKTIEALIDRVVHLGFEVRVELTLQDGEKFSVQLTREQVDELELREGQIVFVRPKAARIFEEGEDGAAPRQAEVV
jgi:sulfate transport system ATP-binding protein